MKESSMLRELYYGNISPWERKRTCTREYQKLANQMDELVEHFKNLLSPEEYEKFTEMQEIQSKLNVIDEVNLFEYAFRIGVLLMIDIFNYKELD